MESRRPRLMMRAFLGNCSLRCSTSGIPALVAGAAIALACVAARVSAHHSTAIYDSENPIELAGTVVEWQFVNPHVFIVLEVANPATGEKKHWNLEGGNT